MANRSHWLAAQVENGLNQQNLTRSADDLLTGLARYPLWGVLGLHEIRQRYRRSKIGPFWITLSMGIFIGALGLLYGKIFGRTLDEYMPYLAAGFLVWSFLSTTILDGAKVFLRSGGMITQLSAPLSVYVYRMVWVNLIIFLHNIWIYIALALWFDIPLGPVTLLAIPAMLLLAINAIWVGLVLGLLSARFRDIPLMLQSAVQLAFFITPVIWKADMLPGRPILLSGNPFYHFVELVRAPLLGTLPSTENLFVVLAITFLGWVFCFLLFAIYRWRIAYWV